MKKFLIFVLLDFVFAGLFSVLNLSFNFDISFFASWLSLIFNAVLVYFLYFRLVKKNKSSSVGVSCKLLEYQPFVHLLSFIMRRAGENGTTYAFDVISVLLWIFSLASSLFVLSCLNERRIASVNPEWKQIAPGKKKGAVLVISEALGWIDAFFQAVFMVLLFQIFFFQFYEIPSESMVPELLIRDKVMVSKIMSGPKFPLSNVGLPNMTKYKRGDVVVFRNPHYSIDRKSEVKTVVSQLVYMLTLTTVKLNVDEHGVLKPDPLVKRVTGLPGEQLMMQDGILYARSASDPESRFIQVSSDSEWAAYNLYNERADIRKYIQEYKISDEQYERMLTLENERREFPIEVAAIECNDIVREVKRLTGNTAEGVNVSPDFVSDTGMWELNLFRDNFEHARRIIKSRESAAWFYSFMTDWIRDMKNAQKYFETGDLYSEANYKLNLMIKLTVGKLILRDIQLIVDEVPSAQWVKDSKMLDLYENATVLNEYIYFLDRRNFGLFPPNDSNGNPVFIPDNAYFMMGDNRFNSLDMRHSYDEKLSPLTGFDDYSVLYYSNLEPQYVDTSRILGTTLFRVWPLNRLGVIGHTARK